MNSLDKIVKRERRRRLKKLKRLFVARDMASKYTGNSIKVSLLDKHISEEEVSYHTIGSLAKWVLDNSRRISRRPPRPPIRIK